MSVPRELSLKDGILYQLPVRELEQYRISPVLRREVRLADGDLRINGIRGRTADLTVEVRAANPETMYQRFAVRFAQNEKWRTGVSFRPHESTLKIDRKFSGSRRAVINQRRALVNHDRGSLKLRLIIDRFSIEVFVNDGEKVMSAVIDTELNADGFSFFADGDIIMNISFYQLKL
jgi:beta-fructofuranosidase